MKPLRYLHPSAMFVLAIGLVGCEGDSLVIFRNDDASNVHLLGPGETESPVNELTSGLGRQFYTDAGPTSFTASRNGQILATIECNVPAIAPNDYDTLVVVWTGSALTCEIISPPDPDSSGGGTSGRFHQSAQPHDSR